MCYITLMHESSIHSMRSQLLCQTAASSEFYLKIVLHANRYSGPTATEIGKEVNGLSLSFDQ